METYLKQKIMIRDPHWHHKHTTKKLLLTPTKLVEFKGESINGVCKIISWDYVKYSRKKTKQYNHYILVENQTIEIDLRSLSSKKEDEHGSWFDERCWELAKSNLRDIILEQNRRRRGFKQAVNSKNLSDESLEAFIRESFPEKAKSLDREMQKWHKPKWLKPNPSYIATNNPQHTLIAYRIS